MTTTKQTHWCLTPTKDYVTKIWPSALEIATTSGVWWHRPSSSTYPPCRKNRLNTSCLALARRPVLWSSRIPSTSNVYSLPDRARTGFGWSLQSLYAFRVQIHSAFSAVPFVTETASNPELLKLPHGTYDLFNEISNAFGWKFDSKLLIAVIQSCDAKTSSNNAPTSSSPLIAALTRNHLSSTNSRDASKFIHFPPRGQKQSRETYCEIILSIEPQSM